METLEASAFDLVALGTGLGESLVVAAASKNGKKVLHLDRESCYGGSWKSRTSKGFLEWMDDNSKESESMDVQRFERKLYEGMEFVRGELEMDPKEDRSYSIDLAAPKLAYCDGTLVRTLIDSKTCMYVEFKALESSYIWFRSGFKRIPTSKAEIFRDKHLSLVQKRILMRYLRDTVESKPSTDVEIDEENQTFVDHLVSSGIPEEIRELLLYGVALLDKDELSNPSTSLHEAKARIRKYVSSIGKYGAGQGAFLLTFYGNGDLPQAFCRTAAVKGATYVLSQKVSDLLFDESDTKNRLCTGIKLESGQRIGCSGLVGSSATFCKYPFRGKTVSRAVCILDASIVPGESQVLFIFPPGSMPGQETRVVRAVQAGPSCQVCPKGKFLLYLSMESMNEERSARNELEPFVKLLIERPPGKENDTIVPRPRLSCSFYYKQHIPLIKDEELLARNIAALSPPDESLDFGVAIQEASHAFHKLYPDDPFFAPERVEIAPAEDDIDSIVLERVMEQVHARQQHANFE